MHDSRASLKSAPAADYPPDSGAFAPAISDLSARVMLPPPFDELVRRHERELMRYLLRVTGDREDAADLFQETWLRAYRAYPRLRPASAVRPWLYAIATNLCRNHFREGARRARVIAAQDDSSHQTQSAGICRGGHDRNAGYAAIHLRRLIAALPGKQREALVLRCFGGLQYDEIAAVLKCSGDSARANVSQAMKKLKTAW